MNDPTPAPPRRLSPEQVHSMYDDHKSGRIRFISTTEPLLLEYALVVEAERDRLAGEVRGLRETLASLPQKIRKCLEPGEGGINITDGVPTCVYVRIGRGDYDDDYELAAEAADEALESAAMTVEMELAALRAAKAKAADPLPAGSSPHPPTSIAP